MTLLLADRQQLAAPRELETVSPPFALTKPSGHDDRSGRPVPVVDLIPDSPDEVTVPSSVVQAQALVERAPDSPMALARLAQAEVAAGVDHGFDSAREALAAAKGEPDEAATFAAARILMSGGYIEEAEEALGDVDLGGPTAVLNATLAAARGDFARAMELLDDQDSVDTWDLRAWMALCEHRFDQAIRFYRKALRVGGPSPGLLANLGLAHAALGAHEKAIRETRQALALGPSDRQRVVFNLVAYLVASGESAEGLRVLRALQRDFPDDLEPVFAEAHWALSIGDAERAASSLRRAKSRSWKDASAIQRAELEANSAYVRWYLDRDSNEQAARKIIGQLRSIEWTSPRLGAMLPILLGGYSSRPLLEEAHRHLVDANPGVRFDAIELQLLILEDRLDEAAESSVDWTERAIFAPEAATLATSLVTDILDDYDRAADIGLRALARMPAAHMLANNVAYALALAGRADEASRLARPNDDSPVHLATAGLIAARQGHTAQALDMYARAETQAYADQNERLGVLVALHRRLLLALIADQPELEHPSLADEQISLPAGWDDDPQMIMTLRMLNRRGASLASITTPDGEPIADLIERAGAPAPHAG